MKGKLKFLYTTILCVTACLVASVCLFAAFSRQKQIVQAVGVRTDNYSLFDANTNVIMSVEKVAVQAGEGLTDTENFTTPLYSNASHQSDNLLKKMYSYNYANSGKQPENDGELATASAVYYNDIRNGSNPKYVVGNNEFVMLDNVMHADGYYYNENLSASYDGEGKTVPMQEAILVSLGQYFGYNDENGNFVERGKAGQTTYSNDNGEVAAYQSGANIELVRVYATHNGQEIELPGIRTYTNERGLNREDFVWVIPQTDGCEGFYSLSFNFQYAGNFYPMQFSFYILLGESYYGSLTDKIGNNYTAQPTLNVGAGGDGISHFYLGESDLNNTYPTLTYDVTKYEMSYTHFANGVTTNYSFASEINSGRMNLVCTETGTNGSSTKTYPLGAVGESGNIAVVVFTEMGRYTISYKYKYNGYNAESSPEMNLKMADNVLSIHGFELKYAKAGYNEAQMRYLTFANNTDSGTAQMGVGLIVPNGYRKGVESDTANKTELGVLYDYDLTSENSVGSLVGHEWANLKAELTGENIDLEKYKSADFDFVKTNQGTLWLDGVDNYVLKTSGERGSFYYYGTTLDELKSALAEDEQITYNNTTSFNKTGYYLAFIKIKVSGENKTYYSVFAFQYTADSVSIHTEKIDGEKNIPIASNTFTNKNVKVWWEEPGVFEREIVVKFIRSEDNTYPTWQQLATRIDSAGTEIENNAVLGEPGELGGVNNNTGATFLIKLQSVGKTASYRTFTIDRQAISGVQPYAVESSFNRLGNVIYTIVKDQDSSNMRLSNSITNSLATLDWENKASGAKITATYTRTPFVVDNSIEPSQIGGTNANDVWYSTKYKLGKTIGILDLEKPNVNSELTSSNVLFEQGIYLFTLTDEAGNSCRYMFVIDKTENYFKITDVENKSTFATRDNLLYTDQVDVEIGTHKTIELNKNSDTLNDELFEFISAAANNNFSGLNYYSQTGTNSANLSNLFASFAGKYYLKVANLPLNVYDNQREPVNDKTADRKYTVKATGSSNVRQFYAVGINQLVLNSPLNSNSYLIVEVNTDHSLGMAYYGSNQQTLTTFDNLTNTGENGATRLYYDDDGNKTAIAAAHATGAEYLAFAWNMGTAGKYQIKSVGMKYYQLDLTRLTEENVQNYLKNYFYTKVNSEKTLYNIETGRTDEVYVSTEENQRAVVVLNIARNQTVAGLYVITREYVNQLEEGDKDQQILSYYYIVDRNGIIVASGEANEKFLNGGYISVGLKDNDMQFNNFNVSGVPAGEISLIENEVSRTINYNVYLTTNRLPGILNIPVGKYFYSDDYAYKPTNNITNGTDYFGSEYYAGKLNFELYFNDEQNQLSDISARTNFLLYSTEQKSNEGYFSLNLAENLSNDIKNRFVNASNSAEYLTLPGDYILIISDNVEGVVHQKVIGIRISPEKPSTNIYSARERMADFSQRIDSVRDNVLTTAEEFVVIDMKNDEDVEFGTHYLAKLDLDYLYVTQTREGVGTNVEYINYNHGKDGGTNSGINIDDIYEGGPALREVDKNDKTTHRKILLDTYLRDENENIRPFEELAKNLSYSVTIRYDITKDDDFEKYADSYYKYENGETTPRQYYYTTYTVVIDRVPPQTNTTNLAAQDKLAGYYSSEMFENAVIEDGNIIHFVRRYKDYYATDLDKAKLYALHVTDSTAFSMEDISRIYYRTIMPETVSLTLPANLSSGYRMLSAASSFGGFNAFTAGCYYEILEQDSAGNTTQYIILYNTELSEDSDDLHLTFEGSVARNGEPITDNIVFDFTLTTNESYTIFGLNNEDGSTTFKGEINAPADKFYRVELYRAGEMLGNITTNFATRFSKEQLLTELGNLITGHGYGNFNLVLISQSNTATYTINYLEKVSELLLTGLKKTENGLDYLDLAGANDPNSLPGITIYAQTIEVLQGNVDETYSCKVENGILHYYKMIRDENGDLEFSDEYQIDNKVTEINGKSLLGRYKIIVTDMFGKVYPAIYLTFNSEEEEPVEITFGENGDLPYSRFEGRYYSYNQANISFDTVIYTNYTISYNLLVKGNSTSGVYSATDNLSQQGYIVVQEGNGRRTITLKPYFDDNNATGAVFSFTIRLYSDTDESIINLVIDTTSGMVSLKDNANEGANKDYAVDINVDEQNFVDHDLTIYSGVYYLSWVPTQNDWYDFDYTIFEEMKDGSFRAIDLNNTTNFIISTQDESTGIYRFVVTIKNKQGEVLGNKVYTFAVQSPVSRNYSVRTVDGQTLLPNSSFKFADIDRFSHNGELGEVELSENKNDIPLYVYNQTLVVDIAKNIGAKLEDWQVFTRSQDGQTYTFTIYRVHPTKNNSVNFYFGTLVVEENDNLIENLQMLKDGEPTDIISPYISQTNNKFYGTNENFTLSGKQKNTITDAMVENIIRKNTIVISVWCNGSFIKDINTNNYSNDEGKFSYEILGSGQYTFVFKDLAGNVHNFNHDSVLESGERVVDELNVIVLQEVVLLVNGANAINNAIYNGQVEIRIFNPGMYSDVRQISLSCTLNGEEYQPEINQYSYIFKDLGSYKIIASATVGDETLTKVLMFTIINPNEARQSFDLSSVFNYQITRVLNNRGENKTAEFVSVINSRQDKNKYLLTYDNLLENSDVLGVTSGKQKFTITYLVEDGIYPAREVEFAFTLNNQIPTIQSSVEPGESTKKSFTITYTPAIIYDYVGDSALYINDILICTIDENSASQTSPQTYTISYKANGKGDYYVILRGASGAVHTSFKITVKEPLNTWSIIVIVVVVGIVLAIVGTIIFLRKRMKIR